MEFFMDLGLFALAIVGIMAFMGIVCTKLAESFGGKKKDQAFDLNEQTKSGWKAVEGKKNL